MIGRIAISLLLCLLLVACREKAPEGSAPVSGIPAPQVMFPGGEPDDLVKNVIVRYNQLLSYGYATLNMNPLQEVTTPQQAEKAYSHMAAIGEGGVRMTSQLKKIGFTAVTFPKPGAAVVKTREVWDFAYNDIKTGVKKEEEKNFVYLVTYTLENRAGRWLITDISAGSEEPPSSQPAPRRFQGDRAAPAALPAGKAAR